MKIDKLIHSKRKTIALIIERDGGLTVRAPMRATTAMIEGFIREKENWIIRTREKLKSIPATPERQFADGETFLFLGSSFDLKLVGRQRPALRFENGFTLSQTAQKKGRQVFTQWYKERALEVISGRVNHFARLHGFQPARVKITSAKTRWGSCSANGALNFTWRLILCPLSVIEYVVVHELAHLRVKNHSRKFWRLVESICPDYKEKRKWLRKHGEALYF